MPSLLLTEKTPLLPLVNTTNKWKQIIKDWTIGFYQEIKYLTLASLWISSAIFILAALNVIGVQANSNQDIDFENAYFTIIKWEVLVTTTISLFISFLKKCLTNFGNNQFKKTLFYQLWNKLKSKIFINTTSETKLNFEEIKNKINLLEANKTTLTAQMKEFHNLQQQLVVKFETLSNNITENEIILTYEENIDNSRNVYIH